jgi:hypothetical protein
VQKLFSGRAMDPQNVHHVLAAFTHRIGIELYPASSLLVTTSVRSHMRLVNNLHDRTILSTESPSEPMLSLAAFEALSEKGIKHYTAAVKTLLAEVITTKNGPATRATHGELVARLLLTIARDSATCGILGPTKARRHFWSNDGHPIEVRTITLAIFLGALLSKVDTDLLESVEHTHVNFTHFTNLEEPLYGDVASGDLKRAWDCGAAFQCSHNQPNIDLMIVTYSGSLSEPWDSTKVGTFCVQVKFRTKAAPSLCLTIWPAH